MSENGQSDPTATERERLERTLDHMLEGCMIISPSWTYLYVNEAAAKHGQQRPENLLGRTMLEVYPGVEKSDVFAAYRRCMETRVPQRLESAFTFVDGTTRWYLFSVEPVPEGIFVLSLELTERVRAEEELKRHRDQLEELVAERTAELGRSAESFRSLFSTMTEGFSVHEIVCDADGRPCDYRFLGVNPAFERLTGLKRDDVVGRLMSQVLPNDDPKWVEAYGRVALTGEPARFENYSPVLKRHYEVLAYRPAPRQFAVVFIDVTERKRLEKELAWLASFPERNTAPIIEADVAGNLHYLNPTAKRLFPELEVRGRAHPWMADWAEAVEAVRGGGTTYFREVSVGGAFYRQAIDYLGEVERVRVYGMDITERKRAEEALKTARDELEVRVQERTIELRRANQTLRMISECNGALAHISDESDLVGRICRIIQELGGYKMAWVGYAEDDPAKTVRPVASAGFEDGYLEHAQITWGDEIRGRGPTGAAIRTREVRLCRDFLTDPDLALWRQDALTRGYRSSLALPLASGDQLLGALTIYSDRADAFGEDQARTLSELANDLALGITALRARAERDHARRIAEEQAVQLRALAMQLGQAEQRERRRLAKVLHDHLQQLLVGARFNLGSLRGKMRTKAKERVFQQVSQTLDGAIGVARSLAIELSPPVLDAQGLAMALEWLGRQLGERLGLEIEVATDPDAEPEAEQVRVLLFEAVREMLLNVAKHAGVSRARVQLSRLGDEHVQVTVSDEGKGFEPGAAAVDAWTGLGLVSIRERLRHLGGRLEIDAAPGRGSRFTLVGPIRAQPTDAPGAGGPGAHR